MDPSSSSSPLSLLASTRSGPLLASLIAELPQHAGRFTELAEAFLHDLAHTKLPKLAVAAATAAPAVSSISPFAVLKDVSCLTPRGKHDLEFSESAILLRGRSSAPGGVDPQAPLLVKVSNVTGVFALMIQDKYRKGPEGCTHITVISLREPVLIGKAAHVVLAFAESGTKLALTGPLSVVFTRPLQHSLLHDPSQLPTDSSTLAIDCADHCDAVRRLLAGTCGRVGSTDLAVFRSARGQDCIKAYMKTSDGFLFPLRRHVSKNATV